MPVPAAVVALCVACAPTTPPAPAQSSAPGDVVVDPTRIDRARDGLPTGYEVTPYTGAPAPMAVWGLAGPVTAQPAPCAELGAPPVDPGSARGWSASGPGGIVYAVVAATPSAGLATAADCDRWTAAAGHTTATVDALPAPRVPAADSLGMATTATTVVEGGTETRSEADTFVAHLGAHLCFVAVVTDPGSPYPPLDSAFAAGLLAETVAALRG